MSSLSVLSASDIDRLGKFCGMLGSDADGERANAAAMATNLLRRNKLTWWDWDVVQAAARRNSHTPPPPLPPDKHQKWAQNVLDRVMFLLNKWERDFLHSMTEWRGSPTEKQQAAIDRIKAKIRDYARNS